MAFSYGADLTVPLDYLRFRIDDKDEEYAEYQDEELNYFINKISGTPTEIDIDKVALRLLKQQLQEIMRGPSRERSGAYEVYSATSSSLSLAIKELEDDIRRASPASPSFGGVYQAEVDQTRKNKAFVPNTFYKGRIYRTDNREDEFFIKD